MSYRVLIVAAERRVGVARFPQTLHRAGARVDVIDADNGPIRLSRFVDDYVGIRPESLVETFKARLAERGPYASVVLADERAMGLVLPHCREEWLKGYFPVPVDGEIPELILSKSRFAAEFADAGLPESRVCESPESVEQAAGALGFPVMIKAEKGNAGIGVRRADSMEDLRKVLVSLPLAPWTVQRFINGRVGSTACLFDRGMPVAWYASFKAIVFPAPFGPSCMRELFEHPQMPELIRCVGEKTRFHGVAGVDWMVDTDNRLYLIEFNPRPMPGFHLARVAGVDFAKSIAAMLDGRRPDGQTPHPLKGKVVQAYMWPQYASRAIFDGPLWTLIRLCPGVARNDVPWAEPRLLLSQLGMLCRQFLRTRRDRMMRRLRKRTHASI